MARKILTIVSALVAASAGAAVPSAAQAAPGDRTVSVTVRNYTNERLSLVEIDASEGDWIVKPPKAVNRNKTAKFSTESTENVGGTAATATYKVKFGQVEFYWSNPWSQNSDFVCDAPDELRCDVEDDSDDVDDARVTFVVRTK